MRKCRDKTRHIKLLEVVPMQSLAACFTRLPCDMCHLICTVSARTRYHGERLTRPRRNEYKRGDTGTRAGGRNFLEVPGTFQHSKSHDAGRNRTSTHDLRTLHAPIFDWDEAKLLPGLLPRSWDRSREGQRGCQRRASHQRESSTGLNDCLTMRWSGGALNIQPSTIILCTFP